MMKGIDVSHHNGKVDWEQVKAAGYGFALLRACFGWDNDDQIDGQFAANVKGCEAAEIPYGLYHYSYATSPEDAAKEARFFLRVICGMKPAFPVWFDFEEPFQVGGTDDKGKQHTGYPLDRQLEIIEAFLDEIEAAGYFGGIYMSASPLKRLLSHDAARVRRFALWVAQWSGAACGISGTGVWQNAVIGTQGTKGMHYTVYGQVPGVAGNCDVNVAYLDYPKIIRENGLNGWGKTEAPDTGVPATVTIPREEWEAIKGHLAAVAALMEKR